MGGTSKEYICSTTQGTMMHKADTWQYVVVQLDSAALGENRLGLGLESDGALVDPGSILPLELEPGDGLYVSASTGSARWSLWITPRNYIEAALQALFTLAYGPAEDTRGDSGGFDPNAVRRFKR